MLLRSIRNKIVLLALLTCLIPVIAVTILFTVKSNSIRQYFVQSSSQVLTERAKMMMSRVSDQQAEYVELKMKSLANDARILGKAAEDVYLRDQSKQTLYPKPNIIKDKSGCYYGDYQSQDYGDLFISGTNKLTPFVLHEAAILDGLYPFLAQSSRQHSEVVYAYFVTRDSIVRGYPAPMSTPEVVDAGILDPYSDFRQFPFYYVADAKHNPKREVKWTDIYFDPGGNGWMFSVCEPVYIRGEMKGVAAFDITTQQIVRDILDLKVGKLGHAFLVNKSGNVIGYSKQAAAELGWRKGIKPDELNIMKDLNNPYRMILKAVKPDRPVFKQIVFDNEPRLVYMRQIESTDFVIGLVVSEREILAELRHASKQMDETSGGLINEMILISLAVLIGSLLIALYFSRRLTKPILELATSAKRVADGDFRQTIYATSKDEISILTESFNQMISALHDREEEQMALTEELRLRNEELESRNHELRRLLERLSESEAFRDHFQALSYTDELTGTYNRRYFEEHFSYSFEECQRKQSSYACIMIDIDKFKDVNDTYGHLAGDAVIKAVSKILLQKKRMHDVVVRFAGDEFIVLLGEAELDDVVKVAERIRSSVENHICHFENQAIQVTTSIGIAYVKADENKSSDQLIKEADLALYKAKQQGRNKVAIHRDKIDAA